MLLNEIRYSIINTAKGGGVRTDDSRLSSRLVDYWIKYYRNYFIPEITDYGKNLLPELVQDMGCQTLSSVDRAECVGALSTVEWDCEIKKVTIPSIVDLPKDRGLIYVGTIGKNDPYDIILSEQESVYQHRLLVSRKPRSYRIGTTLYVVHPNNYRLKYINVRAIFEDPTTVESCATASSCACFDPETTQFPFPDTLVPKLIAMILERELHIAERNIDDLVNDNVDKEDEAVYKK